AVEHLRLLVDRRLRGVEVLRLDAVVVEDPPGPEAHRVTAGLPDRPQQTPAEAVVERAPLGDQSTGHHLLGAEALLTQQSGEGLALARREADPEGLGRRLVETTLGEELAPGESIGAAQVVGVELLRHPVRL